MKKPSLVRVQLVIPFCYFKAENDTLIEGSKGGGGDDALRRVI